MRRLLLCLSIFSSVQGCTINPSQQNISLRPTRAIVEQLLCETRAGVISEIHTQLDSADATEFPNAEKLSRGLGVSAQFFKSFKTTQLIGDELRFYKAYIDTGIALEFTLDAMEEDDATATIDFLRLISNGTISLQMTASNNLSRDSVRSFLISRTFDSLLIDERLYASCKTYVSTPNLEYPISGAVGIADVIHTFIELNEGPGLFKKKDSPNVYADRLTFVTTIVGTVTPKITLSPPTRAFHLTDAMLAATVTRKDSNMLAIGLAFAPRKGGERRLDVLGPPIGPISGRTPFARSDTGVSEDRAVAAIQQQRSNLYLDRLGLLPLR